MTLFLRENLWNYKQQAAAGKQVRYRRRSPYGHP
jgi:hypothetical protein